MIANFDNCLKHLEEMCDFEYNWNGNEAPPLSTAAVCNALLLLEKLPDFGEWWVFPVAFNPGIVQIEFENDKIYIEIECFPLEYEIMIMYPDHECIHMTLPTVKQTVKFLNRIYS